MEDDIFTYLPYAATGSIVIHIVLCLDVLPQACFAQKTR